MTFSLINFIAGINDQSVHIHHIIAHVFWAVIIIHVIQKAKRFVQLFKDKFKTNNVSSINNGKQNS